MPKPKPRKPGAAPDTQPEAQATDTSAAGSTESNPDAAVAAAQTGGTHKVTRPKPQVPPSPVKGDPHRPQGTGVNAKPTMTYDEAMAALEAGTLKKSVLTEQGWVAVPKAIPQQLKT